MGLHILGSSGGGGGGGVGPKGDPGDTSAILVADNGDGTFTVTTAVGGPFTVADNGDGSATLTLGGTSVVVQRGPTGSPGRGITGVARTSGNGAAGSTDTYTITYSDATTSTFTVTNGADGAGGGGGSSLTVQDEGGALATAATTLNFVGAGVTATGTGATKTVTIPGGGGSAPSGELPDNVIATTIPRYSTTTAAAMGSSGQMKLSLVRLTAGQTVTAIRIFAASTAGAGLTHAIAGLYDPTQAGPVLLASSADDTTATWTANTSRTFTMTTPYVVPTTGYYYVAFMVAGTTLPTIFLQSALAGTAINSSPPVAAAIPNSGLTTTLPSPAASAASNVNAQRFYAEVL